MKASAPFQTIDATQMRQVNRSAVLELVRENSPIARSEISRQLKLSLPTVIRIVDELIADGLVQPTGEMAGKTGRPRQLLEYNRQGGAVIGIDLGGTKLYAALANIGGEIVEEVFQQQPGASAEESLSLLVETIHRLVRLAAGHRLALLGIAIGAPGVTHAQTGVVEWAPSLNWREFPLKARLSQHFDLPILVENDVNLAVLGEQWFGAGRGARISILLALGTGMGAGMVIDGVLYRGFHEAAGEVGYFLPGVQALDQHYETFGPMENILSASGIARRAAHLLAACQPGQTAAELTAGEVFSAARQGEAWAVQAIRETIEYLSMVVADVATLLDPEVIILGGALAGAADLLIAPILERIEGVIQHQPRLEVSPLGSKATVMGAISLVLQQTKGYYVVRRM